MSDDLARAVEFVGECLLYVGGDVKKLPQWQTIIAALSHPPQERTEQEVMPHTERPSDDGNSPDKSSPQGTVRDPGAADWTETEDDDKPAAALLRGAELLRKFPAPPLPSDVVSLVKRLQDDAINRAPGGDVDIEQRSEWKAADALTRQQAEIARLTQQLAEADACLDAVYHDEAGGLYDGGNARIIREAVERHTLRTKRSTTTP